MPQSHIVESQASTTACGSIAVTSALEIRYKPSKPLDYLSIHNEVKLFTGGAKLDDIVKALGVNKRNIRKSDVINKLNSGIPLVIIMRWNRLNSEMMASQHHLQQVERGDSSDNYHAMVIIGYRDDGLIIENSHGTFWGKDGTFLLPFELFNDDSQVKRVVEIY